MSYTKVNWDESIPINASNLDTMDQGIKDNDDATKHNNDLITGNYIVLSTNMGAFTTASDSFSLGSTSIPVFTAFITVPDNKALYMRRVRYCLPNDEDRNMIVTISVSEGGEPWDSGFLNAFEVDFTESNVMLSGSGDRRITISMRTVSGTVNMDHTGSIIFYLETE